MKDGNGTVIYVGKAKNLSNRVRSYFAAGTTDNRFICVNIRKLVADIEVVLTSSEKEALLLENNLIKQFSPRFNIKLRDDKDYLFIRLDRDHDWPKLEVVRRPQKDVAQYFGPYHSASAARETLRLVRRHFKIRSCKDSQMSGRLRPCLQHQIHRCLGPCVLNVDRNEYLLQVEYARLFLLGRLEELVRGLKTRMMQASERFEYEKAGVLRDQIRAVEQTLSPQRVVAHRGGDQDVIGMHRQGDLVQLVILEVREGRLQGKVDFFFSGQELPDMEIASSFIMQRYKDGPEIPQEIIVSRRVDHVTALSQILSERRGRNVRVFHPLRGSKVDQAAMADLNAQQLLKNRLQEADSVELRLKAVQTRLRLPVLPRRIECVDISHLGGEDTVGAIGVVMDGEVQRSLGRTYRVRTAGAGDDYGAMTEVLTRRFVRARNNERGWEPPDLLVVDGGRGQLSVACAVLEELGMEAQPVISLAKERAAQENGSSDRVFLPGRKNPIPLRARVSPLHILAMVRDEAHRLAITYQRKTRRKKIVASELDGIPGIGPKTKAALLKQMGSVKRIREATVEDLVGVSGIGRALAETIKQSLA